MRITEVRAVQPPTPAAPADWRTQLGQIVVQITTDSALLGYGVGGGGAAGIHVIETVLRDFLIGKDAREVEKLHAGMCRHTCFYGRAGLAIMALSGVDLALWDLRGKAAGQPVARLLNNNVDLSRPLPTYLTVFDEQETETALNDGHRAVKLHVERFGVPPRVSALSDQVSKAREILGTQGELMIDAFATWDVASTLDVANAIQAEDVAWLEEPIAPDDYAGYRELVRKSPVPIAGGEHEYLAQGFQHLLENRLHAVLQPDVNWCGGLTTLVDVYRRAQDADVRVCPHRGCEPYALHAIAALDRQPLAESGRAWFTCLNGTPSIENGHIQLSDQPGFGVTVPAELWT
ncbi:MAG: mandelate racemase/muconate lactonizing enzyme family protein [Planctomycetota bacterium]|nr:mandelate racemase/muconate lactonizing enzyme family protein [Planctomycetota bacterium]